MSVDSVSRIEETTRIHFWFAVNAVDPNKFGSITIYPYTGGKSRVLVQLYVRYVISECNYGKYWLLVPVYR